MPVKRIPHPNGWASALVLALVAGGPTRALRAEDFPVSPTGIPYTVPAAARAAGWTIVAPESRTAFFGSNPVFLAGGAAHELAVDCAWAHHDISSSLALDRFQSRLAAVSAKWSLGGLSLGGAWQRPFHAQYGSASWPVDQDLQVVLGGAALELPAGLRVGASLAAHFVGGEIDKQTYQASLGAEVHVLGATLAAALKSRGFGADADELNDPGWAQVDARLGLGPLWAVAARLGVGWWDDASDALETPLDAGLGVSVGLLPALRVLAGAHHIRQRLADCNPESLSLCLDPALSGLDQGTYIDLGLALSVPFVKLAVAVEDNHVFGPDSPATWITVSGNASF